MVLGNKCLYENKDNLIYCPISSGFKIRGYSGLLLSFLELRAYFKAGLSLTDSVSWSFSLSLPIQLIAVTGPYIKKIQ